MILNAKFRGSVLSDAGCSASHRPVVFFVAILLGISISQTGCSLGPRQVITTQAVQVPADMSAHQRLEETSKVADAARQSGNFSTCADLYGKVIAQGLDTVDSHLNLAECLLGSGNIDGALSEYKLVENRAPTDVRGQIGMGRVNLVRRQPALALAAYSRALGDEPGNPVATNGKGVALDLLGRHLEAQAVYRHGLAANPDDRTLRNNLGLSLVFTKNYDEAVGILTALAEEPEATPRNRQNLALALGMQGDTTDAKMVAAHDLDDSSVENNLRYYDYMRGTSDLSAPAHVLSPPAPTP